MLITVLCPPQCRLLFRDNLPEVLSTAVASDRNIEKRFKEWLGRCHGTLDKSIRFERLADSRAQAAMRAKLGEGCTVFERTTNGIRTVSVGDVVRIAAKPAVVGRVTCFTVPVAVREEGAYANGRVHIQQLPEEVHGTAAVKTFSMRRLECMLSAKQTEEHCQRETARLPTALRLEPMKFATGQVVELSAGDAVPETSVAVMNAGGQRLVRSFYNGEKQSLAVTQRLWLLPEAGAPLPDDGQSAAGEDSGGGEAVEGAERPAKRSRASRKGKKAPAEAPEAAAEGPDGAAVAAPAPAPELVVSVENKTPLKECFTFSRIARGLKRAGHYALEYVLSPAIAGQAPLRAVVPLHVTPGPAASLKVAGEGVAAVATRDIVLGEALPPFKITLADEFGNEVPLTDAVTAGGVQVYVAARAASGGADDGAMERCKGVAVAMEQEKEEGCMLLHRMQVLGSKKTAQTGAGLALFNQAEHASGSAAAPGQQASQPAAHAASALLCFNLQGAGKSLAVETVPIRLRPGAPNALRVVPRGPWEGTSAVVSCGEELNELTVQAVDTWGNPTAPAPGLSFSIAASCPGLSPAEKSFEMDPSGVTALEGLRAVRSGEQCLALTVGGTAENEALQAAADVALPGKELW